MRNFVSLLIGFILWSVSDAQITPTECMARCNDLREEVITVKICREAFKTLPKPKVGDFCRIAMEQGYSDSCVALCLGEKPVSRVAQACRAASMEMPRPTVRRFCEHGYSTAFQLTLETLTNRFVGNAVENEGAETLETAEEIKYDTKSHKAVDTHTHAPHTLGNVINTIPISLDDVLHNLEIHEHESAEDALVTFCHTHAHDDTASCIKNLLPIVLERLEESNV